MAACKLSPDKDNLCSYLYSVILDSRVDYELKKGYAITLEFATDDIIQTTWPKLKVPATLEQEVVRMQSETIKVNYTVF